MSFVFIEKWYKKSLPKKLCPKLDVQNYPRTEKKTLVPSTKRTGENVFLTNFQLYARRWDGGLGYLGAVVLKVVIFFHFRLHLKPVRWHLEIDPDAQQLEQHSQCQIMERTVISTSFRIFYFLPLHLTGSGNTSQRNVSLCSERTISPWNASQTFEIQVATTMKQLNSRLYVSSINGNKHTFFLLHFALDSVCFVQF